MEGIGHCIENLGANRRPNGSMWSTNTISWPAGRGPVDGLGRGLNVYLGPSPNCAIIAATSSTEVYKSEQMSDSIPSLTLPPCGKERSVFNRYLPMLWPLGIIPNGLMCNAGCRDGGTGSSSRPGPLPAHPSCTSC